MKIKTRIAVCAVLALALALPFSSGLCQERLYKMTTPLVTPRQMYGTVVLGDYVYLMGGNIQAKGDSPEGYVVNVERALINPDGSLGPWQ